MRQIESGKQIIVLASASPRRRELLRAAGIDFELFIPNISELEDSSADPRDLVKINAERKSSEAARKNLGKTALGADTVVALDGVVYGKPRDIEDAVSMLGALQGKTHSVFTGVSIARLDKAREALKVRTECEESRVKFKKLSPEEIRNYIEKVYVLDKAGAYAAQECGELIIDRIDGNFDNVMGLPCSLVRRLIDEF